MCSVISNHIMALVKVDKNQFIMYYFLSKKYVYDDYLHHLFIPESGRY